MATDTKNSQEKEFLQKADIRTMEKDIKRLRESGVMVMKEHGKVTEIKSSEPQKDLIAPVNQAGTIKKEEEIKEPVIKTSLEKNQLESEKILRQNNFISGQEDKKSKYHQELSTQPEQGQEQTTPIETKKDGHLKEIPLATEEKLSQPVKTDEKQRKKFMEDIEYWAQSL